MPEKPILKVELANINNGPCYHVLDKSDIEDIFGKYGRILKAEKKFSTVYIHYNAMISTLMAKKALDGYVVKELGLQLKVNFYDPEYLDLENTVETLSEQKSNMSQNGMTNGNTHNNQNNSSSSVMF